MKFIYECPFFIHVDEFHPLFTHNVNCNIKVSHESSLKYFELTREKFQIFWNLLRYISLNKIDNNVQMKEIPLVLLLIYSTPILGIILHRSHVLFFHVIVLKFHFNLCLAHFVFLFLVFMNFMIWTLKLGLVLSWFVHVLWKSFCLR